jgi:two-component system nitrate/nitrite response regulator NarL
LSPRENQIACLIGNGRSNKEIAFRLNISRRTVKAHLSSIFQKLNISNRLQLALSIAEKSRS